MSHCTSTIDRPTLGQAHSMVVSGLKMLAKGVELYVIALADAIIDRQEVRRNLASLETFDDRMLKDIGLTKVDIEKVRQDTRRTQ